jgi:hypothetical protein
VSLSSCPGIAKKQKKRSQTWRFTAYLNLLYATFQGWGRESGTRHAQSLLSESCRGIEIKKNISLHVAVYCGVYFLSDSIHF